MSIISLSNLPKPEHYSNAMGEAVKASLLGALHLESVRKPVPVVARKSDYVVYMRKLLHSMPKTNAKAYSMWLLVYLASLSSEYKHLILWCYEIERYRYMHKMRNSTAISLQHIVPLFPNGFPTQAGYDFAWESQQLVGEPLLTRDQLSDPETWTFKDDNVPIV